MWSSQQWAQPPLSAPAPPVLPIHCTWHFWLMSHSANKRLSLCPVSQSEALLVLTDRRGLTSACLLDVTDLLFTISLTLHLKSLQTVLFETFLSAQFPLTPDWCLWPVRCGLACTLMTPGVKLGNYRSIQANSHLKPCSVWTSRTSVLLPLACVSPLTPLWSCHNL